MSYYKIKSLEDYFRVYNKSVKDPEEFWGTIADENFVWYQKWDKVLHNNMLEGDIKWFVNGKLNITRNCLDRHLNKRGDKTAILFEPNDPNEPAQHITYKQLHKKVCKMANVLRDHGIKKGDRVCIYLPMIPELPVALLACARIGAIHSVVFAGFSAKSLSTRINDSDCKMLITADGGFRGAKTIDLKGIADEALKSCPSIENVLVAKRTGEEITMKEGRDKWLAPLTEEASGDFVSEIMDAEDPLFILYTSGSTGTPKGMVHTTAGYMIYTAYTFTNVFDYQEDDVYWCTADIGWITGHSYIVYGPLANGATTVLFEGVPSYPDYGRFWDIVDKHKVTQLYTAPTAIRALAKQDLKYVKDHDLSSLRVIGSVGEPINEEAWNWYNVNIGKGRCPIVDTWWQTENGGIMISPLPYITPTKPTFATLPMPGIQPVLMSPKRLEVEDFYEEGGLCIKFPWPGMARTVWNNQKRYQETYYSAFRGKYYSGDAAIQDEVGYYRIIGRMDDVVIVSGHNLGTAPIENAINEHPAVAESAIVGFPHDIKGNALCGYITLKETGEVRNRENLKKEINQQITNLIGPIAKLDKIQFTDSLPKTRSGKIMRRILRKIAGGEKENFGDISTLVNPEVVKQIVNEFA